MSTGARRRGVRLPNPDSPGNGGDEGLSPRSLTPDPTHDSTAAEDDPRSVSHPFPTSGRPEPEYLHNVACVAITAIAFALRFYKINHPDQVVFDEVHFGKFAAYYILREYYFDVHPPLAKLLLGLAGWFVGFDGRFEFEAIGDSYTQHHIPYVGMRAMPAVFGSLTVPIVYQIMKECGFPVVICTFSAALIAFDNAHIAQTRLILLDAALIMFMALSLWAYIRFRKVRYHEFSRVWWGWMCATGFFLACTLGCKMVGLFTFLTIGTAVLVDMWDVLDIRKRYPMDLVLRHFFARALGLIVLPFVVYSTFFWIHFKVLSHSGTGDHFMSPRFQESLAGNELLMKSHEIRYFDTVTIKHKDTKVYLHSHKERYPLKYKDGRISSQGQQVTGYPHEDLNNQWQIIPTKAIPETGRGRVVRHDDAVQLLHISTQSYLLTHDVASPTMPTNQEVTTISKEEARSRYNETLFTIDIIGGSAGQPWKSKASHIRLIHVPTKVAVWTHPKALPEWAFKQQEINGNKNAEDRTTTWYVDEIVIPAEDEDLFNREGKPEEKVVKSLNFFSKFAELQLLSLQHNAGLTASHPYASGPINWPFLLNGISFWTQNETRRQIYLIGNIVGWWTCVVALSVFTGIIGADLLARRRGVQPIPDFVRNRLWNSTGFFFIAWALHYFPFFLMSRQLFIHHYLPAHLCSVLVTGSIFNFIAGESINFPISSPGPGMRRMPTTYSDVGQKAIIAAGIYMIPYLAMFLFMAPLTYGTPGLDGDQVNRRLLLSTWTLHYAGKATSA
ncbi:hypothetical protein FRC17_003259 [Serendipita sp. 399]|nr:hypothetical protein FRC17_003259 [Serendipita sp. 399]